MNIRISAVICTRNRQTYLKRAVQSLLDQTLSKQQYEVIVVDNGSTDNTRQVVEGFNNFGNIRCIHEPIVGLSQARNTGWQNARGGYVAYLDDDAIACREWLERICTAFETVLPRPGSVGGKIVLIWEDERPAWLPTALELPLGHIEWGETARFLTEDHGFLGGGNVAYARHILESSGGFNTRLGRKGSNLLSNDEILLKRYLQKHDFGSYYDPLIQVQHHVLPERLKPRWFYRRYFWQGISNEVLEHIESDHHHGRGQCLLRALAGSLDLLRSPSGVLSLLASPSSPGQMLSKCNTYATLGIVWARIRLGLGHDW